MATAWGIGPDSNGNGTTPEDIQRIIAAEYNNAGIIDGADVKGTNSMAYTVSAGAVILDTGQDMAIKVPVVATTVNTSPAPATGSRTDTVYVKQNMPGTDASSLAVVGVTSGSLPPRSIALAQFTISAGMTATSSASQILNRKFAVPVGTSLGRLHENTMTPSGKTSPNGVTVRGAGNIYVPTDRDIEVRMYSTIMAVTSDGYTDLTGTGSVFYKFYIDGQHVRSWERRYDRIADTEYFSFPQALTEGKHTLHYTTERQFAGPNSAGYWKIMHGGTDKFLGDVFHVRDLGVIRW